MPVVLEFSDVTLTRNGTTILDGVSWQVDSAERWVILGPNGAGKTTLLQLAAAQMHPSRGTVQVLDAELGKVDVFEVRPRIGFASTAMAKRIPPTEPVEVRVFRGHTAPMMRRRLPGRRLTMEASGRAPAMDDPFPRPSGHRGLRRLVRASGVKAASENPHGQSCRH